MHAYLLPTCCFSTPMPSSAYGHGQFLCRYFAMAGAVVILGLGLPARPDTSIMTWAKRQAKKELDEES